MSTKKFLKELKNELGPITFAMFIRVARTSMDMTQAEFGLMIGMKKSTVCDLEKGRMNVSVEMAAKIADLTGLSQELAVRAALQDLVNRAELDYIVELK